jgi:hypothetical protein
MLQDFQKAVVLTSQNPHALLNLRYVAGDPSLYIIPQKNTSFPINTLFVNNLDLFY